MCEGKAEAMIIQGFASHVKYVRNKTIWCLESLHNYF